jgi:hypothetical protein
MTDHISQKKKGQLTAARVNTPCARPLPPNAGKGRKPGVPNRLNTDLKRMITSALNTAGGEEYLVEQAKNNPTVFLALLSRLIPRNVKTSVSAEVRISLTERIKVAR